MECISLSGIPSLCALCQPVHSLIPLALHQLDFFLGIFLWRLLSGLSSGALWNTLTLRLNAMSLYATMQCTYIHVLVYNQV